MSNYFNRKKNVFLFSVMPEDLKNVVCKTKPGDYVPYLCSFECPPSFKNDIQGGHRTVHQVEEVTYMRSGYCLLSTVLSQ